MVSEVKSDENPKPSLHELTPGDNPVSKPPQLGTETSVIGKSKEPITNHTKDAPSIQGRDHKRLESTAQVGLSHDWYSRFGGVKIVRNRSFRCRRC